MKRIIIFTLSVFLAAPNLYAGVCGNAKRGVKTSAMISRYLTDLADNSSGFAVIGSIGKTETIEVGKGKDITAIIITEEASWERDSGKPTVIITGAIHGNEWATPEVCIGIAEYLLENKDNDNPAVDDKGALINAEAGKTLGDSANPLMPRLTSIKQLLKSIQIIIIPVYNPDGYDHSQTIKGRKSYYGAGWRPNRRNLRARWPEERCYKEDGTMYLTPPTEAEHCFLADLDDTASGGDLEEEEVVVCESVEQKTLSLFSPDLAVASAAMFEAIYNSKNPARVVCASGARRIWKTEWSDADDKEIVPLARAKKEGYLQDAYGTDINRNFKYKWDVVKDQQHLFIRTRSPSSRMFRGIGVNSEEETSGMEKLIAQRNVVALIDYHAGSTQVLYPYAYSTTVRVNRNIFGNKSGKSDFEVFKFISEKIAAILNRHDRGDDSIQNFTASQNYNGTSVGSGVARDCYYDTEGVAAINIEVHNRRYTYEEAEFAKVVPEICKTNVPGAVWFLFWAAGLNVGQSQ